MRITRKSLTAAAVAITLTAGFAVGGASVASATHDGGVSGRADPQAIIDLICADPDASIAMLTARQSVVSDRIESLQTFRATAESAGRATLVTKIDKRLEHLQNRLERVTQRLEAAPGWIAAHCES